MTTQGGCRAPLNLAGAGYELRAESLHAAGADAGRAGGSDRDPWLGQTAQAFRRADHEHSHAANRMDTPDRFAHNLQSLLAGQERA